MKSVNACMSASGELRRRADEAGERDVELLERGDSRRRCRVSGCALGTTLPFASMPPVRSPRQCIGPWLAMPRRLCVVIGPFMGVEDRAERPVSRAMTRVDA